MNTTPPKSKPAIFGALTLLTFGTALLAGRRSLTALQKRFRLAAAMPEVSAEEAREIAIEAYLFAYPLVIAELTRRGSVAGPGGAPMNQFLHLREFPDENFTQVVRPNADTLYSVMWFDVSKEPISIRVPDSGGRYYLLQMLDLWSDVFAAPGSRTTGDKAQLIVLAGAGWIGDLPPGAMLIHSPTTTGFIIGRTQTNGKADYLGVYKFQDSLSAAPLSHRGRSYRAPKTPAEPGWDLKTPPVDLVEKMSAEEYFGLFAELMKLNPPHANDYPIVHRMQRIGIMPGKSFAREAAPAETRHAIEAAVSPAIKLIRSSAQQMGVTRNGWHIKLSTIGTYGTDYRSRAAVAYSGFGANVTEDALYPGASTDSDGQPLTSDDRYVMHFDKEQLPPVRGFWSLTMYDDRQLFAANPFKRYAIGDRDELRFNSDDSLDLYIQRESPGKDKESNWLPAPARGLFTMNLRLYWPKPEALNGDWAPPPVQRVA
jgi:hypothetical protein